MLLTPLRAFPNSIPFRPTVSSFPDYLLNQQLAAISTETPGASTQRAFTNPNDIDPATGSTWGPFNPNLFLKRAKPGYTPFDTDPVLYKPGTCGARAWLSPHHYINGCGSDHGSIDTDTSRLILTGAVLYYSDVAYTGTLVKLLPWWYSCLTNNYPAKPSGVKLPAFARMHNTYTGSGVTVEQDWVMPVDYDPNPGSTNSPQYLDGDVRKVWQKESGTSPAMCTSGDSGSSIFCGVNGDTIILSFVELAATMGDVDLAANYSLIKSKMQELSVINGGPNATTISPLVADLSMFY